MDKHSSHTPRTYKNTNGCNTNLRGIDMMRIKYIRWRHFGDVSVNSEKILKFE